MATALLESSIDINAPAEKVWSVVSDLRRMGQRSPQCRKVFIFGGDLRTGSRMLNINRSGWKVWPTSTVVTAFEPNRKVAFKVVENGSEWSYTLESSGDVTTVTERREAPHGTTAVSSFLVDKLLGGNEGFERELLVGMRETLAAIKAEVEA